LALSRFLLATRLALFAAIACAGAARPLLPRYRKGDVMTETAAELVWFAGLVGWYIIRRPFERRAKKVAVSKSLLDRREQILLAAALLGLFVIPAIYAVTGFPAEFDRRFVPTVAWAGVIALITALWLFHRTHVDLGRNWSITLQLREQHQLVRTGVYRYIRHPMYSSFFLLGIAQLLLLPNWIAGIAGPVGAAILYGFRVVREEQMMLESFGEEYRAYSATTKRIVPWVV
jgi:protein-S-isoprenylcysteine O-methyltransferase Ste14